MHSVSPSHVLWQIAESMSPEDRASMIVVGSLAAGFHFFGESPERQLRTKDADCMIATEKAVVIATNIVERLFKENWTLRAEGDFGKPGNADTPDDELPVVRLFPPNEKNEWFLELLSCPNEGTVAKGRQFQRLITSQGHFALCAFGYFALLEFEPKDTDYGIRLASPEMMALCNLLHHPSIGPAVMKDTIAGRNIKRANKDLGRVLALAYLTTEGDPDALENWPAVWRAALDAKFPDQAASLLLSAGSGIRALMASEADLMEAHWTADNGLLASKKVSLEAYRLTGMRFIADVIEANEAP